MYFSSLAILTACSAAAHPVPPPLIAEWSLLDAPIISQAELSTATCWRISPPAAVANPASFSSELNPPVLVVPNADGVIDAVSQNFRETDEELPNPFRVRWHPPMATREAPFRVDSVLLRPRPESACACINGHIFSPGESVEGLIIRAISDEAILLQRGRLTVRCPIGEQQIRLRLPAP